MITMAMPFWGALRLGKALQADHFSNQLPRQRAGLSIIVIEHAALDGGGPGGDLSHSGRRYESLIHPITILSTCRRPGSASIYAERNEGSPTEEATYQACVKRLYPILMTTMAAMLGAVPLIGTFLYLDRLTKRSYPQSPDGHAELPPPPAGRGLRDDLRLHLPRRPKGRAAVALSHATSQTPPPAPIEAFARYDKGSRLHP